MTTRLFSLLSYCITHCVSFSDTYYAWIRRAVLQHFCNFSKPTPFQSNWKCNKQLHMAVIEEPCSAPLTNEEWEDKKEKKKKPTDNLFLNKRKRLGLSRSNPMLRMNPIVCYLKFSYLYSQIFIYFEFISDEPIINKTPLFHKIAHSERPYFSGCYQNYLGSIWKCKFLLVLTSLIQVWNKWKFIILMGSLT